MSCECPARNTPMEIIRFMQKRADELGSLCGDKPLSSIKSEERYFRNSGASNAIHNLANEIGSFIVNPLESASCARESERDQLRAENADLRQRLNDLKDWAKVAQQFAWAHERTCPRHDADEPCNCGLDSFIGSPRLVVESFRTEIADLRKQARESAYKAAQMRGIVAAAEKLLCGLYEHILPLSEHTREVMRDLRNALGEERGDSSHDRPKYEPIVRGGVKGE